MRRDTHGARPRRTRPFPSTWGARFLPLVNFGARHPPRARAYRLSSLRTDHRRDDATGELTSWPDDARPESRSPAPRGTDGARVSCPIDLVSPASNGAVSETPSPDPLPLRERLGATATTRTRSNGDDEDEHGEHDEPPSASQRTINPPPFETWSDAELRRELARQGMRDGPRAYMVSQCIAAYAFSTQSQNATMSQRHGPSTQPDGGGASQPKRRRRGVGAEYKDEASKTIDLEDRLGDWIKRDRGLYDRILLMETVDVDDMAAALKNGDEATDKTNGTDATDTWRRKVPRTKLLAYLESQGVAVVSTKSRRGNKSHF